MTTTAARRPTQHELIVAALELHSGGWVLGATLHRTAIVWGGEEHWLSHNAGRRARELAAAGSIERTEIDGEVHYRIAMDTRQQRMAL